MAESGNISLLVKPASGLCNMRCGYCFYRDGTGRRNLRPGEIMREETAEALVEAAFSAAGSSGSVSFAFQGGEPTLAGLEFFVRFCGMVRRRNTEGVPVAYSIQTNGLLLDETWASFLKEQDFLAGLSLDGTAALHDMYRRDAAGGKTYARVRAALRLLTDHGIPVNLLCVVTEQAARRPEAVWEALRSLQVPFLQLIPCLDPPGPAGRRAPWSLSPDSCGRFLCAVFSRWLADWEKGSYVSVRQFEDWLRLALGMPPEMCASCGSCGGYLAVESDGGLYPCDFYVLDEWRLGEVSEGLPAAFRSERMAQFRRRAEALPAACRSCPHFALCRGGCPRNWQASGDGMENGLCRAFRMFFDYAAPRIRAAAGSICQQISPRTDE